MAGSDVAVVEPLAVDVVRVVDVVARLVDACPRCGRGERQHGRLTCEQIDGIAARVAFYSLPRWRRLFRSAPSGARRARAALPPGKINMPSRLPSPTTGEGPA